MHALLLFCSLTIQNSSKVLRIGGSYIETFAFSTPTIIEPLQPYQLVDTPCADATSCAPSLARAIAISSSAPAVAACIHKEAWGLVGALMGPEVAPSGHLASHQLMSTQSMLVDASVYPSGMYTVGRPGDKACLKERQQLLFGGYHRKSVFPSFPSVGLVTVLCVRRGQP